MAQTTSLVFNGGVIPSPSPVPAGSGKAKLLKIGEITVTEQGVQVTKNVICDPDSITTVAPFMEVLTSAKFAELVNGNNILVLDDGTNQYLMADATVVVEDGTAVCTSVSFLGLSLEDRAKVLYPCTRITDELTLQQVLEVGEPVETSFDLVKAYPEDTEAGTLIDKLEIEDTIDDDPDYQPLLEIHPTDGKVAINEDGLHEVIGNIIDTIDELDVDSVPHAYLHSTLAQSAGDSVTTGTQINVFALTADLVGDCFEFEQTTTIDDTPFGYVWIEPGTYLINASVTLQWVGNPRGTFIAKVGSVMGENFDFSQEQEIKRNTTKVVTIPNRMKLAVNVTYDAGTPVMGFWIQSMQVVKLAGGMSQTNIIHDDTLVGQGSMSDPLGVDEEKVAQSTLAGNLAPAFDPTRTEDDKYLAGESVTYDGKVYVFKVDHYGAWNETLVESNNTLLAKAAENHFYSQLVRDIVTTDGNGNQINVNLFEQIIPVPATNQWFNKDACKSLKSYIDSYGMVTFADTARTVIFRVKPNTTYNVSLPTGSWNRFDVAVGSSLPVIGSALRKVGSVKTTNGRSYYHFTTGSTETYCAVYYFNQSAGDSDESAIRAKIMCQEGLQPSADYISYEFKSLSFNSSDSKDYDFDVSAILKALEVKEVEDVTSSFDLSETALKYIHKNTGEYTNSSNLNVSEAIPLDALYAFSCRTGNNNAATIAYYCDEDGVNYVGCDSRYHSTFFLVYPRTGVKSFRICTPTGTKLYKASLAVYENAINEAIENIVKSFDIVLDDDVTSNFPLSLSLKRIDPTTGIIENSSIGAASYPFLINRSVNLCVTASDGAYHSFLAFYKDVDGLVPDKVIPVQGSGVVNYLIIPPVTAKSFRLASNNTSVYEVHTCHFAASGDTSPEIEQRLENVESDVGNLEDQVADLQESTALSQVIDTVRAVKYKPQRTLYLGANVFDFASLSYDSNVWSVDAVNGTISYLGGSLDPIVMEAATDNNGSYAIECTTSNYVQQTGMFRVAIGDGFLNDPYNGTDSIFCGAYSDGGYLKIYPYQLSNTFTLSNISFRKKVPWAQRVVEKIFECRDVNSGNGDGAALDAKWNVAIGPTPYTQGNAANLSRSVAIGYQAQAMLIGGLQNIAIGTFAQNLLKYALRNIAIGCDCLYTITHADDCIALGKGCLSGSHVSWNDPSTWQHLANIIAIGSECARVANGQTASNDVYIGHHCATDGIGNKCTIIGADGRGTYGKTNCTGVGYNVIIDKDNQAVFGNANTTETKVFGNLVVSGTDNVKRKIVFNNDNTCSWEVVS